MVLGYDTNERVVRAVLTGPVNASHAGIALLGRPRGEVRECVREHGLRVIDREAELVFPDDGFSAWTLRAGDDHLPTVALVVPGRSRCTPARKDVGSR
ncbi:hypothetical protein BKD26_36600 [Streptomyces sp. CB03238]|nr:hypothetical protein BKD26_36600 [Streptomyces sp. CB03238]